MPTPDPRLTDPDQLTRVEAKLDHLLAVLERFMPLLQKFNPSGAFARFLK